MYIKRNADGTVCAISYEASEDFTEFLEDDAPELEVFLSSNKTHAQKILERSDMQMARVMEDTVNLLIDKGIIQFTELPGAAQAKLLSRRKVRGHMKGIDLLDDDEEDINI